MYHCKNDRSFRPETTLWSYHTLLSRYPDTSDVQFPRTQYVIVWRCPLLIVPLKYTIRRPERVATSQRVFARRPPTHHRSSKRFPPPLRYPVSQSTPWLIWPWHPIQKFRYWIAIRMACDYQIQNDPTEVVHWPRFGCDWRSYSLARTDIVAMTIRHAHNNNSTVTVGQWPYYCMEHSLHLYLCSIRRYWIDFDSSHGSLVIALRSFHSVKNVWQILPLRLAWSSMVGR